MSQWDLRGLLLLAFIGVEALTIFVSPLGGVIAWMVLLLLLIASSSLASKGPARRFYLALGLVPLVRIANLSMPLSDLSTVYTYPIMALPLLVGAVSVAIALRMRPGEIGLTARCLPLQVLLVLLGAGIGLADYFILRPEPLIDALTWRSLILPAIALLAAAGFAENLAFRGVLQRAAESSAARGWIYVAIVWAVLQMGLRSAPHMALAAVTALVYGWAVKRTGSILGVSISQGVAAICLYLLFPFLL